MEKYKEKLEKELGRLKIFMVAALVLIVIFIFVGELKTGIRVTGLLGGMIGYSWSRIQEIKKLLQDEQLLRKNYISLHDERTLMIGAKAGRTALFIALMGVFAAMLIAAFIDKVVFYTLFGVVVFMLVVMIFTSVYYDKKM